MGYELLNMKKIIIYALFMMLLAAAVSAQTMVRELPSSVSPGQSFTLRYQSQNTAGNFGVLIDDSISGGCNPNSIATGFLSPATYSELTITAPASGICIFTGTYQFANTAGVQPETNFPAQSVAITSGTCSPSSWTPSRSTYCLGTSFTQTSNCNTTRSSTGTKTCDTGGTGDKKDSGSGGIFIIVAVLVVLAVIFSKSIIK